MAEDDTAHPRPTRPRRMRTLPNPNTRVGAGGG